MLRGSAKGRGHRRRQPGGEGGSRKQCPFTSLISSTADARSHGGDDGKERLETEGADDYRFSNDQGEELSSRSLVRNHQGRIAREGITLVSTRDRWVVSPDVSAKASPLHCEPPRTGRVVVNGVTKGHDHWQDNWEVGSELGALCNGAEGDTNDRNGEGPLKVESSKEKEEMPKEK
ncbi:hypothetical protein B296_00045292 [Ensete ventricosum]|uniref:Uncharacterized protein n=1 Tax=Ensete ventricosum TaxID=4639 RepID=A0A426YS18_ENSVE|nr:hypothetical protein B296_00045292 [Ensete ventricosum]